MNFWQLRTFQTVSRILHFTRASEELNLSQPAVSHQIKSLEIELGETLFFREKSGIFLTPAGSIVLGHVNKMLHLTEKMRVDIEEARQNNIGTVKLCAVLRFLENPFARVYRDFKTAHPNIELRFEHEKDASRVAASVLSKSIVAGFMATKRPKSDEFASKVLGTLKMMFVVGEGHRLANRESVDPSDVINEHWAIFEAGDDLRKTIDNAFAAAGIVPKSIYCTNDGSVISDLVASGEFVSILPSYGITRYLSRGQLLNITFTEMEYQLPLYLFWRPENQSPVLEAFIEFISEYDLPGIERNEIIEINEA